MSAETSMLMDSVTVLIAVAALIYIATLFKFFRGSLYGKTFQLSFAALVLLTAGRIFDLLSGLYNQITFGALHDITDLLGILVLSAAMIALYREWRKID